MSGEMVTQRWFATRDEAVAWAVGDSDDGDVVYIHWDTCRAKYNEPCSCPPQVIIVKEGRA